MMRLNNEEKRKLIQELLEDKHKLQTLSREYGVHPEYVRRLLRRARIHGVESVLFHGSRKYTTEFKLEVIRFVESGHSASETSVAYNLSSTVVDFWLRKYSEGGIDALYPADGGRPLRDDRPEPEKTKREKKYHTEKEYQELERRLRLAEMENEFLKKLDALVRERIERERRK